MSSRAVNIALIALGIVGILLLIASVALYIGKANEKIRRIAVGQQLEDAEYENTELRKDLDEIKVVKSDLELKLTAAEQQAQALAKQFEEEKKAKLEIAEQIQKKDAEIDRLKTEISSEKSARTDLEQKLKLAQKDYSDLEGKIAKLKRESESAPDRQQRASSDRDISLEKIVVKPSFIEGSVMVVNDEFNFVIVDLGTNNGIQSGMSLSIYRDDAFLGKVQVEKIYEDMCAAAILPNWTSRNIQEGDKAVLEN